ncbi:sensor histidine kinase [Clostridium tagluense]|uniref:sensor histidine kinase n=1 Tax=Clostridium tagluense TaxID=360422 RepID=UPI001CF37D17|nr:histidine kinase [Clostridium tagluense]MCB2299139.1 histidine kinase [Clostridium tagluense]
MDKRKIREKISSNWRIIFIIVFIACMLLAVVMMYSLDSDIVSNGKVDFNQNKLVNLNGKWEFYWDRLLTPKDFTSEHKPQMDTFMKVPGSWHDKTQEAKIYPDHGVATYRVLMKYPDTIKNPALSIKGVTRAYKLYASGRLIEEIGKVSNNPSYFEPGYKPVIVDLPKDNKELELIIQVSNLDYVRGGFRKNIIFGSKQALEHEKMVLLVIQTLFTGSVFIFAFYYFLLFFLQRKNKTALLFSLLCFLTALRSLILGEIPLAIFFPSIGLDVMVYINFITMYNFMPIVILVVLSIYPLDYKSKSSILILVPTIFFDALLFTSTEFMALFYTYFYILMFIQIIYILVILIRAVLRKCDNAIVMFIAISILALTIIEDTFHYAGGGGINISYMFLYGDFVVIIAMSFVQARLQASAYKKLILYNEKLIESDILKDKIMATEMSFLQAQIKPHFLYNALSAIANVCEKDGEKASKLIVDLAIYLRNSLEFNHLDKMVTIEKEMEFVDTYFNIEQARFGEKIQLIKDIEIPLDYQIPILIIQPLVENSVRHGISKRKQGGKVYIRIKQTKVGTYIEIQDDGVGINGEKLEMLLSENRTDKSVGLLNIHHRLLRLYGRGLEISSIEGKGTWVKIMIPKGGRK